MGDETPVVPLREVTRDESYKAGVVQFFEELLGRAKAGEFTGAMVVVDLARSTKVGCKWTGARDCIQRLGALEMLKADWIKNWYEEET